MRDGATPKLIKPTNKNYYLQQLPFYSVSRETTCQFLRAERGIKVIEAFVTCLELDPAKLRKIGHKVNALERTVNGRSLSRSRIVRTGRLRPKILRGAN